MSGTWASAHRELLDRIVKLEDQREEALREADHWKALWQGTVEDSTKVIQERDEALRALESIHDRCRMWPEPPLFRQGIEAIAKKVIQQIGVPE